MAKADQQFCPVFRPNKQDFSRPFCEYIQKICKANPDIALFKVVPPKGWTPRKSKFPSLQDLRINTPIKQHVFGTGGAFRCIFEEQKAVSVADFKKMAYSASHATPPKGHRQDDLLERAFWSAVTINPPYYGADTPHSFFDEKLEFGWNLRDLKDLLTEYDVPPIPGVTTPMTYFGMWKSFFSWHVEDVDLYSINYLHFGAPKVWYCVSPKDRLKFEAMAKNLFPELHRVCPAFLRHKDILFSPKTLRNHHIEYMQAKQEVGEFIVLNAGAYHSGFNLGFNCAEAVNFATSDWLPAGKGATQCSCTALPDSVHLDMRMFSRGPRVSQRLKAALQRLADGQSDSESEEDEEELDSDEEEEDEDEEEAPAPKRRTKQQAQGGAAEKGRGQKRRSLNELSTSRGSKTRRAKPRAPPERGRKVVAAVRRTPPAAKVPASSSKKASPSTAKKTSSPRSRGTAPAVEPVKRTGNPFSTAARSSTVAKLAAARGVGSKRMAGLAPDTLPECKRRCTEVKPAGGRGVARHNPAESHGGNTGPVRRAFEWVRSLMTGQQPEGEEIKSSSAADDVMDDKPFAIVGEEDGTSRKYFHLVQQLKRRPKRKGMVAVRWLREEADGVFRATGEIWEEARSALVRVRTQALPATALRPPGFRLLTLRSRILDTELVD